MIYFKPITRRNGDVYVVKVSYKDAYLFNKYKYYIKLGPSPKGNNTGAPYCARSGRATRSDGSSYLKTIFLHTDIVGSDYIEKGMVCDHINRVTLDNRRENLRIVSIGLNNINTKRFNGYPYFRFIFLKKQKRYKVFYKQKYLGGSAIREEAEKIRDDYFREITKNQASR